MQQGDTYLDLADFFQMRHIYLDMRGEADVEQVKALLDPVWKDQVARGAFQDSETYTLTLHYIYMTLDNDAPVGYWTENQVINTLRVMDFILSTRYYIVS